MNQLNWFGPAASDHVHDKAVKAVTRAAIMVERRAKELLSTSGGPSAPGEPPHKQTGQLRRSVAYEVDARKLTARVGTNTKYGLFLELGSRRGLAPRPWLRRALNEARAKLDGILSSLGKE